MHTLHVIVIYLLMCRSWNNCSTNIQRQGCTFYDLLVQVLQYPEWSWLTTGDDIQPYKEAIDALHHSCNNIEPGTNTRRVARILHWRGGGTEAAMVHFVFKKVVDHKT